MLWDGPGSCRPGSILQHQWSGTCHFRNPRKRTLAHQWPWRRIEGNMTGYIIENSFQRMETFCQWNLRELDSQTTWCLKTEQSITSFSIFVSSSMAKISIASSEICNCLQTGTSVWCLVPGAWCLHLFTSLDAEESAWRWKHCGKPGVWCNPVALRPRCQNWFHFSEPWSFEQQKRRFEVYVFSSKISISKYHEVTRGRSRQIANAARQIKFWQARNAWKYNWNM